jgi:hypothetical protein
LVEKLAVFLLAARDTFSFRRQWRMLVATSPTPNKGN